MQVLWMKFTKLYKYLIQSHTFTPTRTWQSVDSLGFCGVRQCTQSLKKSKNGRRMRTSQPWDSQFSLINWYGHVVVLLAEQTRDGNQDVEQPYGFDFPLFIPPRVRFKNRLEKIVKNAPNWSHLPHEPPGVQSFEVVYDSFKILFEMHCPCMTTYKDVNSLRETIFFLDK